MRRELRGLRRLKESKVDTELRAIDNEIQKVNIQDNLLSFLKSDFKSQMQDNMQEIEQTENVIDNERATLKADIDQTVEEEKALQEEIYALDKQLRLKEKQMRAVQREGERKIDAQQEQVYTVQNSIFMLEKKMKKD